MKNHRVIKTIGAIALSVSLILGGTVFTLHNKTKDYSTQNQIETIASALDCDLTYMKNNNRNQVVRMKHNGSEPIYVSISTEHTEDERRYITQSLDYVFDIVSSINNNYHYKIVDESEIESHAKNGKTTISYHVGEANYTTLVGDSRANGLISRDDQNVFSYLNKPVYHSHKITYDREMNKDRTEESKQYTFLHELLHAFGFDDVMNTTAHQSFIPIYCGHTVMNSNLGDNLNCLTPNDYRAIISAYAPQMNEKELLEFIENYKQKTKEYDESFYHSYAAICEYKTNTKSTLDTTKDYSVSYTRNLTDVDGTVIIEHIFIKVQNGKYEIVVTDENMNILEQTSGKTLASGNTLILKNAVMKKGLRPLTEKTNHTTYINDFVLMQDENGKLLFYNLADNDIMPMKNTAPKNANSSENQGFERQ